MKTIVKMKFGSHLYGTNTEKSDTDYKGVFLPNMRDVLLGKIPRSISSSTKLISTEKNTKDDIDTEMYSLHYFIKLACEGETVALDMLHAPDAMILETSDIWKEIASNRSKFYTKDLKAFVGYARTQAAKYGVKGSRLSDAEAVLNFFKSNPNVRLKEIWSKLPEGEHISKDVDELGVCRYVVCGRKIQETATTEFGYNCLLKYYENYGARALQAKENKGIDWKAVSHAIRAALQVKQILQEGTITFPLREAEFLKKVKAGALDYTTEVGPRLEKEMEEVEALSLTSTLPSKVDRSYWDEFIIDTLKRAYDIH